VKVIFSFYRACCQKPPAVCPLYRYAFLKLHPWLLWRNFWSGGHSNDVVFYSPKDRSTVTNSRMSLWIESQPPLWTVKTCYRFSFLPFVCISSIFSISVIHLFNSSSPSFHLPWLVLSFFPSFCFPYFFVTLSLLFFTHPFVIFMYLFI